ncbi:MAG: SsrA-binding protein SmpB [Bacteroidetes bacterium]|nr:SsrA-binding protein SmpB [Bacteroidota bacterium]
MKIITTNRRAQFDYEILDSIEAGIVLQGPEVKSVKLSKIDLSGGYLSFDRNQRPWLINVKIAPYPPAKGVQQNYNPTQARRLLLNKQEINKIIGQGQVKGLTTIPLKVYNKHGLIKIEIAIVRGKRNIDKRAVIKKRELDRKIKKEIDK